MDYKAAAFIYSASLQRILCETNRKPEFVSLLERTRGSGDPRKRSPWRGRTSLRGSRRKWSLELRQDERIPSFLFLNIIEPTFSIEPLRFLRHLSSEFVGDRWGHMVLPDYLFHPVVIARPNPSSIASLTVLSCFFCHTLPQTATFRKWSNVKLRMMMSPSTLNGRLSHKPHACRGKDASPGERVATRCSDANWWS